MHSEVLSRKGILSAALTTIAKPLDTAFLLILVLSEFRQVSRMVCDSEQAVYSYGVLSRGGPICLCT